MNEDFDYCKNLVKEFVDKKLSGELDNLKDFNFWELYNGKENISILLDDKKRISFLSSEKNAYGCYADVAYKFDPDNSKIMNAIYYLLYEKEINDLRLSDIGTGQKYRGDTINTYGTLFCLDSLKDKNLIPVEIQDMVLAFQKKYLTIGNFYLLPNISIKGETINKYRGVKSGWRDYFPKFLEELEEVLNNSTKKNVQLFKLVQENSFYFNKVKTIEEFLNLNFLNDFKDKEKVAKIEKRYSFKYDREKPDYIQFAKDYIEISTEIITSRADEIIKKLRPLMER